MQGVEVLFNHPVEEKAQDEGNEKHVEKDLALREEGQLTLGVSGEAEESESHL